MNLTPAQRKTVTWLLLAALGAFLVWLLGPVLMPFVVAWVLAYVLRPAVEALVKRHLPRWLAVLLVEVAAVATILAVLLLLVPIIAKELPLLRAQIPLLADRLNQTLVPWLSQYGIQLALDSASIKAFVVKYLDANLEEWLGTALSSARIGGSFLLAIVGNAILIPAVLFYLLMDWANILARFHALVPPRLRPGIDSFLADADEMLGHYLRGQLLVMGILAVFYSVGLALFGFELAVPVGVFTGLAVFIPYLGFGLGLVLALLAAVLQFGNLYGLVAVAVVFGLGQVVESFYLTPRLVGERIGLSPLAVIFALLAFGHLFGFVGVLIALPVCAVLSVAWQRVRQAYLQSQLYQG
jgi:predicted PurR-regulated permease PerM